MRTQRAAFVVLAAAWVFPAAGCPGGSSNSQAPAAVDLSGGGPGSSPSFGDGDDDLPGNQLPPDATAGATPSVSASPSPEHVAPEFGGGDFGITLVEPPGNLRSPPVAHFAQPLKIPTVLAPSFRGETADFYDVHETVAQAQILPGTPTTVYSYNGEYPGPTFVATLGRPIVVRHHNDLTEAEVVHLHGSRSPPGSDGHPADLIPPGASRDFYYPNPFDKPASTLWYHDHAMDMTGPHVYKGLAGFYLIADPVEDKRVSLPSGIYDVPLVIQDRLFSQNNQFVYPQFLHNGVYGDTILVNGVPYPFLRVETRKYRFRILNGSNARTYQLALSDGSGFSYIANGGGLLPGAIPVHSLQIPVADRGEIVIDFSRYPVGTSVRLLNLAGRLPGTSEVMRFDIATKAETDSPPIPPVLRPLGDFDDAPITSATIQRTFVAERRHGFWVLNGKTYEPNRIDAAPHLDQPEIWTLVNKSGGWVHPIHIHLGEGVILDRNGIPAQSSDQGFRDVFLLHQNETVRVLIEFKDYAGRYVFHCHNLEHEDMRMMSTFRTLGTNVLPVFPTDLFPFEVFPPPDGPTPVPARKP